MAQCRLTNCINTITDCSIRVYLCFQLAWQNPLLATPLLLIFLTNINKDNPLCMITFSYHLSPVSNTCNNYYGYITEYKPGINCHGVAPCNVRGILISGRRYCSNIQLQTEHKTMNRNNIQPSNMHE